jgi:hypothetical protein
MVSGETKESPSPYRFIDRLVELKIADEKVRKMNAQLINELKGLAYPGSTIIAEIARFREKIDVFTKDDMYSNNSLIQGVTGITTKSDDIIQIKTVEINTLINRYVELVEYVDRIGAKDPLELEGLKLQIYRELVNEITRHHREEFKAIIKSVLNAHGENLEFAQMCVDEFLKVLVGGEPVADKNISGQDSSEE